jgi:hypothetical protein
MRHSLAVGVGLATLVVGYLAGSAATRPAAAGPTFDNGRFVTQNPEGNQLFVWSMTNGRPERVDRYYTTTVNNRLTLLVENSDPLRVR